MLALEQSSSLKRRLTTAGPVRAAWLMRDQASSSSRAFEATLGRRRGRS